MNTGIIIILAVIILILIYHKYFRKFATNYNSEIFLKIKTKGVKEMEIQQDQRGVIIYRFKDDAQLPTDVFSITGESSDTAKLTVEPVEQLGVGEYKFVLNWAGLGAAVFTMTALRFENDGNPHTQQKGITLIPNVAEIFESEESVEEL